MGKEYLLLIGTIIGFLGTLIVTFTNNRQQLKRAWVTNEHNLRLEKLKIITDIKREHFRELLSKLEEAATILSKLTTEFSTTTSYITSSKNLTPEQYHERYLEKRKDLDRLKAIIDINFSEFSDLSNEFAGLTNIFWGNQQNYLLQDENGDRKRSQFFLDKVVEASQKIQSTSFKLNNSLASYSRKLSEELQEA